PIRALRPPARKPPRSRRPEKRRPRRPMQTKPECGSARLLRRTRHRQKGAPEARRATMQISEGGDESFISHLIELRDRLLRIIVSVLAVFACLAYWSSDIYSLLARPLLAALPSGGSMIATDVVGVFL